MEVLGLNKIGHGVKSEKYSLKDNGIFFKNRGKIVQMTFNTFVVVKGVREGENKRK